MRKARVAVLAVVLTMGLLLVAGPAQAETIADFQFGAGSLDDQSGNSWTATLNGNAVLGEGGVALTGGYITTDVPLSTVTGGSMTIEVITSCRSRCWCLLSGERRHPPR